MAQGDEIELTLNNGKIIRVTEDGEGECRSCGETIVWCFTAKGRKMPVDVPMDGAPTSSHFATCPHAGEWRDRT